MCLPAPRVPIPVGQLVWHVLDRGRQDVLAGLSQRFVARRGEHDFAARSLRDPAALAGVPAILQVLERAGDLSGARVGVARSSRTAGELGQVREGQVHLRGRARHPEGLDPAQVVGIDLPPIDERQERALGVGVGDDDRSVDLLSGGEGDPAYTPVLGADLGDLGSGPELNAPFPACLGHRLRDGSHPAAHEPPR